MKKTDKLVNCADSQALEFFIGCYLLLTAYERAIDRPGEAGFLAGIGLLTLAAALHETLRPRQWACAACFASALFLWPSGDAILVSLASAWTWYRTILDHKVKS